MDVSQVIGFTSRYARKYALNGLFCIDDVKYAHQGLKIEKICKIYQIEDIRDMTYLKITVQLIVSYPFHKNVMWQL